MLYAVFIVRQLSFLIFTILFIRAFFQFIYVMCLFGLWARIAFGLLFVTASSLKKQELWIELFSVLLSVSLDCHEQFIMFFDTLN